MSTVCGDTHSEAGGGDLHEAHLLSAVVIAHSKEPKGRKAVLIVVRAALLYLHRLHYSSA